MAYIAGGESSACFLCDSDGAEHVLDRGTHAFALLNRFPYNTGHVLVAPYRHVPDVDDLTSDEMLEVWDLVRRCVRAQRTAMGAQGCNVGINLGLVAGAGVPGHLHVHAVPRWGGDTNFMPVLADTKVLPEMLEQTAEKLRSAF